MTPAKITSDSAVKHVHVERDMVQPLHEMELKRLLKLRETTDAAYRQTCQLLNDRITYLREQLNLYSRISNKDKE